MDEAREVTSLTGGVIDGMASYFSSPAWDDWKPKPPPTGAEVLETIRAMMTKMQEQNIPPRDLPDRLKVTPEEMAALRRHMLAIEDSVPGTPRRHLPPPTVVAMRHGAAAFGLPIEVVHDPADSNVRQWIEAETVRRVRAEAAEREAELRRYFGIPDGQ